MLIKWWKLLKVLRRKHRTYLWPKSYKRQIFLKLKVSLKVFVIKEYKSDYINVVRTFVPQKILSREWIKKMKRHCIE